MDNYIKQFQMHRKNAKRERIPFTLTYEEWLEIWIKSGHLSERGIGGLKYCMSRIGDKGGYTPGNVFIQTNAENVKQAPHNNIKRGPLPLSTRSKIVQTKLASKKQCVYCLESYDTAIFNRLHGPKCKFKL